MPSYVVTKTAPKRMSGVANPGAGKRIILTEAQAEHHLREGHVSLPTKKVAAKSTPKTKVSDQD